MKIPSLSSLIAAIILVESACALQNHPRLIICKEAWEALPARMEKEPVVGGIVRTCIARADRVMGEETLTRELEGRRLLGVSREAIMRVVDLATAWKVTNNRRYLERCRDELIAVSGFTDWNPSHLLDVAEMQTAVAIGYDWLYHDLDAADLKTIESALIEKGLKTSFAEKNARKRTNNWNQVCNGGLILSAIALQDVEPDLAQRAIKEAISFIPSALDVGYPPDGAYSEGGGYWEYGTIYTVLTIEALANAGFHMPSFARHPGLMASGNYIGQVYGTSGLLFNYGDNRESGIQASSTMTWMAREQKSARLRDFVLPAFRDLSVGKSDRFLAFAAFWLPDADGLKNDRLPTHFHGAGKSPIAIHRTGFGDRDLFLGIKAGKAGVNHGHMDAGSFVLDFLGTRWALDLGLQKYHSLETLGINLFSMSRESGRWKVFRLNNTSHNTLTYNGKPHDIDGEAVIVSSEGGPNSQTVLDLSKPLGIPKGAGARRTFKVHPDGSGVTIVDELSGLNPGDVIEWKMLTRAQVGKEGDGLKLESGREKLMLVLTAEDASEALATPVDPPPAAHDQSNPGVRQITMRSTAGEAGKVGITAVFRKPE
jgi:hypothetical protein